MGAPDRYLGAIVRLLPATRREWGRAMQAELASIERVSDRWRFALGCTRVALLPTAKTRAIWLPFAAAVAAGVVLVAEVAVAGAIGQTVPLVLVLALLVWLGRRPGYLGPVRPDRTARVVRAGGYALVGTYLLALVAGDGDGPLQPNRANWGPVFALMLTLSTVLFLALTARSTRFGSAGLAAGACGGLVAGLAAFAAMPFQRGDTSLADGLPGHGRWLMVIVFAAPAAAALLTVARSRRADHGASAALCAGTVAALIAALLGFAAIVLFPRSLDQVRSMMPPGTSEADLRAESDIGASDAYGGVLVFGTMLAAALWVTIRPLRAETTSVLLALLAVLPAAFGLAVGDSNPGAAAILFAGAGLTLVAATAFRAATTTRSDVVHATS